MTPMPPRTLVTFLVATALVSAPLGAQTLPKAEAILDRYVEVTGGRSAYQAHHSEILAGTIEFPAQGLKGKVTRYVVRDKEYSVVELPGLGSLENGINGGVSWEKTVLLGPRLKGGAEKDQALREAYLNAPIFWRELFPKVATAGVQSINGEECYEVVLTPPQGAPEHQFFSKKTGLLSRTVMVATSQMGEVSVEVDVSGYKSFGGVLMPTQSKQSAAGQELIITVDDVRVNELIPDDRFALPTDVAELVRKPAAPPEKTAAPASH